MSYGQNISDILYKTSIFSVLVAFRDLYGFLGKSYGNAFGLFFLLFH